MTHRRLSVHSYLFVAVACETGRTYAELQCRWCYDMVGVMVCKEYESRLDCDDVKIRK